MLGDISYDIDTLQFEGKTSIHIFTYTLLKYNKYLKVLFISFSEVGVSEVIYINILN